MKLQDYYGNRPVAQCQDGVEVKGALSREFRSFLVKTVLKLSVANFIHAQHCV